MTGPVPAPDDPDDPLDQSIARVAARLRSGELSCEALTAAALSRADAVQPALNAFIPLAHKDCFERAGEAMTVGSQVIDRVPGVQTATAPARLDDAGAIDLGMLNMSEMVAGPTG